MNQSTKPRFRRGRVSALLPAMAAIIASVSLTPVRAAPTLFSGTEHYYDFISGSFSWPSAETAAEALTFLGEQGHLVTIFSSAENDFIFNNVSVGQQAWMGATDSAVEGEWRWVTGELFWLGGPGGLVQGGLYANWENAQPDNFNGSEDAGIFLQTGQWNDGPSSSPNPVGFIVEFDVPEPGTLTLLAFGGLLLTRRRAGGAG